MTYATQADMIERFGAELIESLTDREVSGQIDAETLASRLADADAAIDAIIYRRYEIPLPDPVHGHVVRVACDLALANLYDHEIPDEVAHRRDMAHTWLRDVAAARADIPGAIEKAGAGSAGSPEFEVDDRVFTRDTLGDF